MTSSAWRLTSRSASGISRRSAGSGIRKAINGPFTFAPDGNPLVGPVRGVRNFWVACAVMAGFSQGGGIGLVLSRWMAENDPGPGHPFDGRLALRRIRHARNTPPSRFPRITRAASAWPIPTRNCRPPARCAARRSTTAHGRRCGDGRELRAGACTVVRTAGRGADRDADLSPLGGLCPSCAPSVRRCAPRSASTRPRTTANTR